MSSVTKFSCSVGRAETLDAHAAAGSACTIDDLVEKVIVVVVGIIPREFCIAVRRGESVFFPN